jgi:hypothetical protein
VVVTNVKSQSAQKQPEEDSGKKLMEFYKKAANETSATCSGKFWISIDVYTNSCFGPFVFPLFVKPNLNPVFNVLVFFFKDFDAANALLMIKSSTQPDQSRARRRKMQKPVRNLEAIKDYIVSEPTVKRKSK